MNLIDKRHNKNKGSLTVEAAIVLPIFIFVIITVAMFIKVVYIQELVGHALKDSVNEMALTSYLFNVSGLYNPDKNNRTIKDIDEFLNIRYLLNGDIDETVDDIKKLNIKDIVKKEGKDAVGNMLLSKYLKKHDIDEHRLNKLGAKNLSLRQSTYFNGNEDIDAVLTYEFELPVTFKTSTIKITQRAIARAWMSGGENIAIGGKNKEDKYDDKESTIVFVSSKGSRYHRYGCNMIFKNIKTISKESAITKGFTPCENCIGKRNVKGTVYVTEGNMFYDKRYHIHGCISIFKDIRSIELKNTTGIYWP
ncbi:pilus assembly protein [Clostridiaceae bacterium M8S5]|nr:pilus assembly protein [Clostridiaceae bacterium M8S5]